MSDPWNPQSDQQSGDQAEQGTAASSPRPAGDGGGLPTGNDAPEGGSGLKRGTFGRAPGIDGRAEVLDVGTKYDGDQAVEVATVRDPNTGHHVQVDSRSFIPEDQIPAPGSEGA